MQDLDLTQHNPQILEDQNQESDLSQAIETLCDVKNDLGNDWARECFDVVIMALKEKEAMQ